MAELSTETLAAQESKGCQTFKRRIWERSRSLLRPKQEPKQQDKVEGSKKKWGFFKRKRKQLDHVSVLSQNNISQDFEEIREPNNLDMVPSTNQPELEAHETATAFIHSVYPVLSQDNISQDFEEIREPNNLDIEGEILVPHDLTLALEDPNNPAENLGSVELSVRLSPKEDRGKEKVIIDLIEGRNLKLLDSSGSSDPYVIFKVGKQTFTSKTQKKTSNPQWRERFAFDFNEEQGSTVDITVWDYYFATRDDCMGKCTVDLSNLARERTHTLELPLSEGEGTLLLLVTVTGSDVTNTDLSYNITDNPQIKQRYGLWKTFNDCRDVGTVQVKVVRAEGLRATGWVGKSDPYCVVELNNDLRRTHTVYKNLNPEWNKNFTFNVKDIYSVLEVTVYDEDTQDPEFLGKVEIPLAYVQKGTPVAYALKTKEMTQLAKGVIYLEINVLFNAFRAGFQTVQPIEQKYMTDDPDRPINERFRDITRIRSHFDNAGRYIRSIFSWDPWPRSLCALVIFIMMTLYFQLFMIPLAFSVLMRCNIFEVQWGYTTPHVPGMEQMEDKDEDCDNNDVRNLLRKIKRMEEKFKRLLSGVDTVVSYMERITNLANNTAPFLTFILTVVLDGAFIATSFIPWRFIVLGAGLFLFAAKPLGLSKNNKLLNFLSRVPTDSQLEQYRPFPIPQTEPPENSPVSSQ